MSLTEEEVAADLALAGLMFVGYLDGEPERITPPDRGAASCEREHGRFDSPAVSIEDPEYVAKVNAGWWQMATEYDLFDERREFLLGVDLSDPAAIDAEYGWARVRLLDGWAIAGSACWQLRGWRFEVSGAELWAPEFSMYSLDNRMLLHTTFWGNYTTNTIAIRPDRLSAAAAGA